MEINTYTYDHAERLTKVEHSLNGVKVTLAANTYDELGRLSGKSLHGSASNKLAYAYNIRNWIESISSGGLFNISLYYGYNGNVSRMVCRCQMCLRDSLYPHKYTTFSAPSLLIYTGLP